MVAKSTGWRRILGLAAVLAGLAGPAFPTGYESLLRHSPFGQPAGATSSGPVVQPLEFRGVVIDGGTQYFSVRETKTRTAVWLARDDTSQPFAIRAYDAARGVLSVEYQGTVLDLALKDAVILVSDPGAGLDGPTATPIVETAAAASYRIGHVAEEIRRRRAMRAADHPR